MEDHRSRKANRAIYFYVFEELSFMVDTGFYFLRIIGVYPNQSNRTLKKFFPFSFLLHLKKRPSFQHLNVSFVTSISNGSWVILSSYSITIDGQTLIPDKMCENEKVLAMNIVSISSVIDSSIPHAWLNGYKVCSSESIDRLGNPTTKHSFNTLYGKCPYCSTPLFVNLSDLHK